MTIMPYCLVELTGKPLTELQRAHLGKSLKRLRPSLSVLPAAGKSPDWIVDDDLRPLEIGRLRRQALEAVSLARSVTGLFEGSTLEQEG